MTAKRPAFADLHNLTRRQHNHSAAPTYVIQGEHLTMRQIAARLGIQVAAASSRWRSAAKQPGAVTWSRLQIDRRNPAPAG